MLGHGGLAHGMLAFAMRLSRAGSALRTTPQSTDGGERGLVTVIVADAPHPRVLVEGSICGRAWKNSRRSHGSLGLAARARTDYRVALDAAGVCTGVLACSVVEVHDVHGRAYLLAAPDG